MHAISEDTAQLKSRPEPRSDFQGLGVFNCPAIEWRGRFCGQSRCDDKGDKRADGTQKHRRNEGVKGGVVGRRQSRAADTSEGVLQDTRQQGTLTPAWLVGALFMTSAMPLPTTSMRLAMARKIKAPATLNSGPHSKGGDKERDAAGGVQQKSKNRKSGVPSSGSADSTLIWPPITIPTAMPASTRL